MNFEAARVVSIAILQKLNQNPRTLWPPPHSGPHPPHTMECALLAFPSSTPSLLDIPENALRLVCAQLDPESLCVLSVTCGSIRHALKRMNISTTHTRFKLSWCLSSISTFTWAEHHGLTSPGASSRTRRARMAMIAAQNGAWEVLSRLNHYYGIPLHPGISVAAALAGHVGVLDYLKDNGHAIDDRCCPIAKRLGHVNVLKWRRKHGCRCEACTPRESTPRE